MSISLPPFDLLLSVGTPVYGTGCEVALLKLAADFLITG